MIEIKQTPHPHKIEPMYIPKVGDVIKFIPTDGIPIISVAVYEAKGNQCAKCPLVDCSCTEYNFYCDENIQILGLEDAIGNL
jgi:hypothetical protein